MPPDLVIGVDVGGTKMLAGVVARDGSIGRTIERPTSTTGQAAVLDELDRLVEELLVDGAAAIGVGVPMNLDRRTGIGFGAVNPRTETIEDPREVAARVAGLADLLGRERVFLNPDCGFGTFAERPVATAKTAFAKLQCLAAAARSLRG